MTLLTLPVKTTLLNSTKLKAIRLKYRHAVDSGKKSAHGRVVLLYFELCEQIWGGSLAVTIPSVAVSKQTK